MKIPVAVLALASLLPVTSRAQTPTRVLAGRVIDALTGEPLRRGVVRTTDGRVTDRLRPDGVFVLRVPVGDIRLVVRSLGYRSAEVPVPWDHEVTLIELSPDPLDVDAIVVSGRATDIARARSAVAATTLREDQLDRVPAESLEEVLAGKAAGVASARNSGAPGDVQVQLRGVTTILGHGRPLWVLDGLILQDAGAASGVGALVGAGASPVPSRIADLNPHDIASVEVLRGAAATAMYGSRGANGVVIVRTKRG